MRSLRNRRSHQHKAKHLLFYLENPFVGEASLDFHLTSFIEKGTIGILALGRKLYLSVKNIFVWSNLGCLCGNLKGELDKLFAYDPDAY